VTILGTKIIMLCEILLSLEPVHSTNGSQPDYIFGNVLASNIITTTALQIRRILGHDNSERDV
jgi:hypothetical protein